VADAGHNGITPQEWIHAVLNSGEVTRIGQHLALVLYHLSDSQTNIASLSARDLERITGWGRTAIIDHLSELEIFIRVTWGRGRGKSKFELQGVIASVVTKELSVREADTRTTVRRIAVNLPPEINVREADRNTGYVREADAKTDTTADTIISVRVTASEADTNPTVTKEKSPHTPLKENTTKQLPPLKEAAREGEEQVGEDVFVNCRTVRHPKFTISLESIVMQLQQTLGMAKSEAEKLARNAAIANALQWSADIAAGKPAGLVVPGNPANAIRGSIVNQRNKQGGPAKSSIPTHLRRF
jgi:hypothetical protein